MRSRILLLFTLGITLLFFAAWAVSMRTKDQSDLVTNPLGSPFSDALLGGSSLPVLAQEMPEFAGIETWLNSEPLTAASLKGKVVLVDFWTYSCINCIRTLPYVTSWHEKYKDKGFTVVGVHTPEFAFEKDAENVREAIARHRITYPVPLDNDYGTWNAYSNHYWPAHYLFDAKGRLRYVHFGEGKYDETERNIQALLEEAGQDADMTVTPDGAQPSFSEIGSPETYLGYGRMELLSSPEDVLHDAVRNYSAPQPYALNRFYLSGGWRIEEERAIPSKDAKLFYRYDASTANLVMSALDPSGPVLRVEVKLDGKPVPEGFRGADLNYGEDGTTYLLVKDAKLYEITDAGAAYGEHLLELSFPEAGTAGYAFTFG
jgi:thiol-disulfide isomerase/thioredoxin